MWKKSQDVGQPTAPSGDGGSMFGLLTIVGVFEGSLLGVPEGGVVGVRLGALVTGPCRANGECQPSQVMG